jgi:RNA polymerase-binding transcription factor DksA
MAIQKKKTTSVVQKSKSKKAAPKKPVLLKKVTAKKSAPVKKVQVKKVAAKKPLVKKVVAKKAAASKKNTAKVVVPTKKIVAKKSASKLTTSKKITKPIIKTSPVKKTAKAGVKKAVPTKLATPKKASIKKPVAPVKKAVPKVEAAKKTKEKIKPVAEKHMEKASINHKEELKKALSTVKEKIKEKKKVEKPFVMPKTNTERQRKYEPEFTKSVLDQSPDEYNGPTMRYSDSELVEFRELISRKLETAKKELGYLQGLITRKDQMGGDDTDNRYMTMEDGSLSMEREQLSQMASRQITFIDHLEKAMMRIENKTYGICRVTGKLIDKARLRAVPHATLSIEAKMGIAR